MAGCARPATCGLYFKERNTNMKKLEKALNKQLNRELTSEYLYLSMAAYLENIDLPGFANFMKVQVLEERAHAMKFFDYINSRGARVVLQQIEAPAVEFDSVLDVFAKAYDHERYVTQSINELMGLAVDERDFATQSFLNWFIDEQVEEEATFLALVNRLKLIDGKGPGLFMMDKELSTRQITQEVRALG